MCGKQLYLIIYHGMKSRVRRSSAYETLPIAMTDDEALVSMLYKACLPAQDKALIGIW